MKPHWPLLVLSVLHFERSRSLLQLNYGFLQESPCFPLHWWLCSVPPPPLFPPPPPSPLQTFVKYSMHSAYKPFRPTRFPPHYIQAGFFLSFTFSLELNPLPEGPEVAAPFVSFSSCLLKIVFQQLQLRGHSWSMANVWAHFIHFTWILGLKWGPDSVQE